MKERDEAMTGNAQQVHAWHTEGAHVHSLTSPTARTTKVQVEAARGREAVSGRRLLEEADSRERLSRQQTAGWRFLPEVRVGVANTSTLTTPRRPPQSLSAP